MDPTWKNSWPIPGTQWTLRGFSRAAYRTGFYIQELNIMLDAGPQLPNKPDHIFITHTHGDHIANLPFTLIDEENKHITNIYAPKCSERFLREYISALFNLNACAYVGKKNYIFHPMESGMILQIPIKNTRYNFEVFACDHSIDTVSYGIKIVRTRLNEEYKNLSGKEIGELRKQGIVITYDVEIPAIAYLCDTTIAVFQLNSAIFTYPVIIVECTFLYDDTNGSKHISWGELKPFIIQNPNITFVLIHFSTRYKEDEIKEFFVREGFSNVKPWI